MAYLLALTLLLLPAYVIRFSLLGLPTDALMVWVALVWLVFAVWLTAKAQWRNFFKSIIRLDKAALGFISLFFLAALVSLFIPVLDRANLGQFVVLCLQPISLFFVGRFLAEQKPKTTPWLLAAAYLLLAAAGLYAIIQYFTLFGLPTAWWGNNDEPKRALSFFIHPNFYALWSAPLLAFLIPDLASNIKGKGLKIKNWRLPAWLLGATGLLLSLSRAGWLGLAVAMAIYVIAAADAKTKKIVFAAAAAALVIVLIYPNLRWRLILPLYGEKSAVSRFSLWHTGWKGIKESPLAGLGLTGFSRQWETLNTDPGLKTATHNFPHNIFLDFWVETGLLGLIAFVGIAIIYIYRGLKNRNNIICLGVSLFLIAIIFSGLVDNPYFKNDLAMVFWLILALAI